MSIPAEQIGDVKTYPRIPENLRAKIPAPSYLQKICGYCATNTHQHCPTAIRSGQGNVIFCPCPQHPKPESQVRCLECGNQSAGEVDEKLWLCWSKDECQTRIKTRLGNSPQYQLIHSAYMSSYERMEREKKERPARNRNPGRPSSGSCLCCGEKTGGGKFLPGHDARLVSKFYKRFEEGEKREELEAEFAALGVSDALKGKLARKLDRG